MSRCNIPSPSPSFNVVEYVQLSKVKPNSSLRPCLIMHITLNRPFPHYAPVSKHKEMRMRLRWIFIQITVFCPPKPWVGAFVYRNVGKVYYQLLISKIIYPILLHFTFKSTKNNFVWGRVGLSFALGEEEGDLLWLIVKQMCFAHIISYNFEILQHFKKGIFLHKGLNIKELVWNK